MSSNAQFDVPKKCSEVKPLGSMKFARNITLSPFGSIIPVLEEEGLVIAIIIAFSQWGFAKTSISGNNTQHASNSRPKLKNTLLSRFWLLQTRGSKHLAIARR